MKVYYVSSAMDTNSFRELFINSVNMPGQQAQKYNRLLMEGLAANGVEVNAITSRPVTSDNCDIKFLKSKKISEHHLNYHYCTTVNIPFFKVVGQFLATFFNILIKVQSKDSIVIVDVLNASIAYGAVLAAKLRNRMCIGIVTDLPELMVTGNDKKHSKLVAKVIQNCTGYIFLTEAMNTVLNHKNKPYVVIEGVCDIDMSYKEKERETLVPRVCMYAGLLDARYGVKNLVDGFILSNLTDTQLHIYGNGPYVSELKKICEKNKNIVYMGNVINEKVVEAELRATILVNPRPTKEEFAKYSFPSKNMEYMVSGTPLITTKLPGMPKEYDPYVYLFEGEAAGDIAIALKKIMKKSCDELFYKGNQAKKFVLEEKNNVAQALKIIHMCERR